MALNWNVKDVENYEEKFPPYKAMECGEEVEQWNTVTYSIVMATLAVGLGWKLTEKNIEEFTERLTTYQVLTGPLMYRTNAEGQREARYITPQEIRDHLGLEVNTEWDTKAQWKKKVLGWVEESTKNRLYLLNKEAEEKEAA